MSGKAEEYHSKEIEALEVKEPNVDFAPNSKEIKAYIASLKRTIEIRDEMYKIAEKEDKGKIKALEAYNESTNDTNDRLQDKIMELERFLTNPMYIHIKHLQGKVDKYRTALKLAAVAIRGITGQSDFISDVPEFIDKLLDENHKQV